MALNTMSRTVLSTEDLAIVVATDIRTSALKSQFGFTSLVTPEGYSPKTDKGRARGYSTAIMYFAPADLSGYDVCQYRSAGCTMACLNTAGHGGIAKNLDAAAADVCHTGCDWQRSRPDGWPGGSDRQAGQRQRLGRVHPGRNSIRRAAMSGRMQVFAVQTQLVTEECYSCHVLFAMPNTLHDELVRQKAGRQFYCPNGHSQHYVGEPEEVRLKRELERAQQDVNYYKAERRRLADDNMTLAKEKTVLKGTVTKLKKRAANGVCAFCHRHFANMQRHMDTKHPGVTDADTN